MSPSLLNRAAHSLRHAARSIVRDRRGVAAVEFAYIAPVLLIMLMGTFELARGVSIDRRLNSVSAMASEIIAREDSITPADLDKVAAAMKHVMEPYDDDSLIIRLIGVRANSNDANNTKVEWSYEFSSNGSSVPYTQCQAYTLDPGLVSKGGSVIVAEVGYTYAPVFGGFVYGGLDFTETSVEDGDTSGINRNWTSKAFHAPRKSCVDYNGTNCVLNCPG